VLGPMAELGDETIAAHDRVGRLAVRLGVTHLVTVGEDARAVHEAARQEGMFGGEAIFAATIDDAIAVLRARMEPDAVVLVKASRAAGLERVALAGARPAEAAAAGAAGLRGGQDALTGRSRGRR